MPSELSKSDVLRWPDDLSGKTLALLGNSKDGAEQVLDQEDPSKSAIP